MVIFMIEYGSGHPFRQVLPTAICMYCCNVKQRISLVSDSVWVTSVVLIRFGVPLNLTSQSSGF